MPRCCRLISLRYRNEKYCLPYFSMFSITETKSDLSPSHLIAEGMEWLKLLPTQRLTKFCLKGYPIEFNSTFARKSRRVDRSNWSKYAPLVKSLSIRKSKGEFLRDKGSIFRSNPCVIASRSGDYYYNLIWLTSRGSKWISTSLLWLLSRSLNTG